MGQMAILTLILLSLFCYGTYGNVSMNQLMTASNGNYKFNPNVTKQTNGFVECSLECLNIVDCDAIQITPDFICSYGKVVHGGSHRATFVKNGTQGILNLCTIIIIIRRIIRTFPIYLVPIEHDGLDYGLIMYSVYETSFLCIPNNTL